MGKFHWQDGYGAFSYGKSQLDKIYNYIKNQESQHKERTFHEEYIELLKRFGIEYDQKYLFNFFEYIPLQVIWEIDDNKMNPLRGFDR